jgi:hypothetical protein
MLMRSALTTQHCVISQQSADLKIFVMRPEILVMMYGLPECDKL